MRRALTIACLTVAVAGATSFATAASDVVVSDGDDVSGKLDIVRVSMGKGPDGRLRAVITMASSWDGGDLVSQTGPPGSICARMWTAHQPKEGAPDFLACVSAKRDGQLTGGVFLARGDDFPRRAGDATVARPSTRSVVIRFAQSTVGRPSVLRFAVESTRAGCTRTSCVDTAPNAPSTRRLVLRRRSHR
jgi:hypothetical protein